MIIAFNSRNDTKRHVLFGYSSTGDMVTYCGFYFRQFRGPHWNQKRCKKCTKALRSAGMSWKWFEAQEK